MCCRLSHFLWELNGFCKGTHLYAEESGASAVFNVIKVSDVCDLAGSIFKFHLVSVRIVCRWVHWPRYPRHAFRWPHQRRRRVHRPCILQPTFVYMSVNANFKSIERECSKRTFNHKAASRMTKTAHQTQVHAIKYCNSSV